MCVDRPSLPQEAPLGRAEQYSSFSRDSGVLCRLWPAWALAQGPKAEASRARRDRSGPLPRSTQPAGMSHSTAPHVVPGTATAAVAPAVASAAAAPASSSAARSRISGAALTGACQKGKLAGPGALQKDVGSLACGTERNEETRMSPSPKAKERPRLADTTPGTLLVRDCAHAPQRAGLPVRPHALGSFFPGCTRV